LDRSPTQDVGVRRPKEGERNDKSKLGGDGGHHIFVGKLSPHTSKKKKKALGRGERW